MLYNSTLTIFLLCKESAEFLLGKLVSNKFSVVPGFKDGDAITEIEGNLGCSVNVKLSFNKGYAESAAALADIISKYDISHFGYHYTSDDNGCVSNSNIKRSTKVIRTYKKSDSNIIEMADFKNTLEEPKQ
jgi:hypothetical protein